MSATCDHGFWLADCALCQKRDGECDYGSCTAPASTLVGTVDGRGVVVERRPMCPRHAPDVSTFGRSIHEHPVSAGHVGRFTLSARTRSLLAGHARLAADTGSTAYISGDTGRMHGPNPRCSCRPGSLGFCAGCVGVDFMAHRWHGR